MVQSAHCSLHNSVEELQLPNGHSNAHSDSECNMLALASQVRIFFKFYEFHHSFSFFEILNSCFCSSNNFIGLLAK